MRVRVRVCVHVRVLVHVRVRVHIGSIPDVCQSHPPGSIINAAPQGSWCFYKTFVLSSYQASVVADLGLGHSGTFVYADLWAL